MPTYTGVGSRDIPEPRQRLVKFVAAYLARLGWCLRTGGAEGSDTAFEDGAMRVLDDPLSSLLEVYLPWPGFGGRWATKEDRVLRDMYNQDKAKMIARRIHPAGDKLKDAHQCLHGRNAYQVLGVELEDPSDCIVYYAPPDGRGSVKGGTRTAVELARRLNIPELNLYHEEVALELFTLIKQRHPNPLHQCYKNIVLREFYTWLDQS